MPLFAWAGDIIRKISCRCSCFETEEKQIEDEQTDDEPFLYANIQMKWTQPINMDEQKSATPTPVEFAMEINGIDVEDLQYYTRNITLHREICGSTNTRSGRPCQNPVNCRHHGRPRIMVGNPELLPCT